MRAALIDCILAMAVGLAAGLLIHPSLLFGRVGTRRNRRGHK